MIRQVLYYPNPALREKAVPVQEITPEIKELIEDLKNTCIAYRADGLAATQISEPWRIFVTNIAGEMKVYINPEIIETDGEMVANTEGCLSFPTIQEKIKRHEEVTVKFMDEEGEERTFFYTDHEAVAVQHELDHLDGILMVDHMGKLQRRLATKKLSKLFGNVPTEKKAVPSKKKKARAERKRQQKHKKR